MSKFTAASIFWWPALLRLSLYSMMTVGGVFLAQIDKLHTGDTATWGWVEWSKFLVPIFVAWISTKLAWLDQTLGRMKEEKAEWTEEQTI